MHGSTTTVRVSRRTHQILSDLAQRRARSVTDLLDELAECARRQDILDQYNTRMAELLSEPEERTVWDRETTLSEASAAEVARQ